MASGHGSTRNSSSTDDSGSTKALEQNEGESGSIHQSTTGTESGLSDRNSAGAASTRSLVGSILEYTIENGRRYCGRGLNSYFMPNDEMEQTRLNIVHQMYLTLLGGELSTAPIRSNPERILDIGTGTGEWAIGMAEQYPNAEVIGTDLSAIQPRAVPSNVYFELDDAEEEWTFSTEFDLIHLRDLAGSFSNWSGVFEQSFRHLAPGGYIEVVEFDHIEASAPVRDSYLTIFMAALGQAFDATGRSWSVEHLASGQLEAAGFVDVQSTTMHVPIGMWPESDADKLVGKMWLIAYLESLEAISLRMLTRVLGWSTEAVLDICEKVRDELANGNLQLKTPLHHVTARKSDGSSL